MADPSAARIVTAKRERTETIDLDLPGIYNRSCIPCSYHYGNHVLFHGAKFNGGFYLRDDTDFWFTKFNLSNPGCFFPIIGSLFH
ncbi:MAG: hypothetical protein ACK2UM_01465 [Anaerolineales bacterium]